MSRPGSVAALLASLDGAPPAVRFELVGKLGHIRRSQGGKRFYLDFRPYGRVYSNHGVPITDEETARRLLEKIRGEVAEDRSLEEVLARYQPAQAKPNLVPSWLARWLEVRRRESNAGSLSPLYLQELERLVAPGGHLSFFDDISIHELNYGRLEDWSLWLADRGLRPKTRRNVVASFRAFLTWLQKRGELRDVPEVPRIKADEHDPQILAISDQDRVLAAIPEAERGPFLAMGRLGLRPGEARALTVADYHDGWITVDKAVKGKTVTAPVRGTKTGKPKRLPVDEELQEWIERHVDPTGRLSRAPLFANPRTGRIWAHKALARVWQRAVEAAGLPHISLYEGTKHTMATDAIRRGVPERHLQRFLGHAAVESTRRYARLADSAMVEVLRPRTASQGQAKDKVSENETEKDRTVKSGPSRTRTWDRPVIIRCYARNFSSTTGA